MRSRPHASFGMPGRWTRSRAVRSTARPTRRGLRVNAEGHIDADAVPGAGRSRQARERREPEPPRLMELVKVGRANNQAEAEFLQGLLLEEGVPSVVQRGQGSDVPDFLAAGARDLLVSRENAQVARDVLLQGDVVPLRSVPAPPTGYSGCSWGC